jgi:hypothetical protein
MGWTTAGFHEWLNTETDITKRQRAWKALTKEQEKAYNEYLTFRKFAAVAPLDINPQSIENRDVPEPDIYCLLSGVGHHFELGEVTDPKIAKAAGDAAKADDDIYGGFYSQSEPLQTMVEKKCSKTYATNGLPVSLLLHYTPGHQVPFLPAFENFIAESRPWIEAQLKQSAFDSIWFFNRWDGKVMAVIER